MTKAQRNAANRNRLMRRFFVPLFLCVFPYYVTVFAKSCTKYVGCTPQ